jgi:fatty acid/phospholipid biosynthesis enzyme
MSGDFGVDVTVPSALQVLREHKDLYLTLVGDADVLKQKLGQLPAQLQQRITILKWLKWMKNLR